MPLFFDYKCSVRPTSLPVTFTKPLVLFKARWRECLRITSIAVRLLSVPMPLKCGGMWMFEVLRRGKTRVARRDRIAYLKPLNALEHGVSGFGIGDIFYADIGFEFDKGLRHSGVPLKVNRWDQIRVRPIHAAKMRNKKDRMNVMFMVAYKVEDP